MEPQIDFGGFLFIIMVGFALWWIWDGRWR